MLLHILTKKGKGYEPAIAKPDKFHGLGKFEPETGETAPRRTPTYSELLGKTLGEVRRLEQQDRRHHRRDAERHRPGLFPGATSRPLLRCRHRRGARGALCLRPRHAGTEAVPHDLLDLHAARLRHDHPRHGAAESERRALHGSRPGSAATTARRITASSISATCATCRTSCTCSRRMKMSSSTCSGRWRTTTPGRSRSVIRAARALARCRRPRRSCSRSARRKWCNTARDVAIFGLGNMFEVARGSGAQTRGARDSRWR